MDDVDPGLVGDLLPDVAGAHRALPALAGLLAGYGHEAEVADRGAVGLGIAVDDDDALAAPRRRQRVGEADDAGADDGQIVVLIGWLGGQVGSRKSLSADAKPGF